MKQTSTFLAILCGAMVGLFTGDACCRGADDTFAQQVRPFLATHCFRCHGEQRQQGDLRLDLLQPDFDSAETLGQWIEVMDNLNLDEMPPADQPRPAADDHRQVVAWIGSELRQARNRQAGASGRVLLRRMNRTEFSNTIRDLLQMEFLPGEDPAELLPPDPTFNGFNTVSSALMLDPSLLDNYYAAAAQVAARAIVAGPPAWPTQRTRHEMEDMALPNIGHAYVCGHLGTDCREHDVRLLTGAARVSRGLYYPGTSLMFPAKGKYKIRVRASASPGDRGEPVKMVVERINGREGKLLETIVDAPLEAPRVYESTQSMVALPNAHGLYMTIGIANGSKLSVGMPNFWKFEAAIQKATEAGDNALALKLRARMMSEGWTGGNRPSEQLLDTSRLPQLVIDWVEIEGPLYEQWPPRSHKALFFKPEDTPPSVDYAREIFTRFLPRAYRRPVTTDEVERVVGLVRQEWEQGATFEKAVEFGLTYVLSSPAFLYLLEPDSSDVRPLDDYELASRLSYFLWSSMPDDRLRELAGSGKLQDPAVLAGEVDRLLADSRSQALVDGFAAQWLKTAEFRNIVPDRKIYPDFDPTLQSHVVGETLAFFEEILRNDLSVLNFIDSDFVMANEPLAKFYGLEKVSGLHFRKVPLPADSPRGGLLGQAGVALLGSDGIRTKPVSRGVYVREVLFNDPPDPPPPNVGEIEPNIQGERLTVRDRLLQHQQIEACASCHRGIDPYGLAMENFDATGAWRILQNGEDFRGRNLPPVQVDGRLPNGKSFATYEEFKGLLREQPDRFRRALLEKLLVYALGRPVEAADREALDAAVAAMASRNDSLRDALHEIVAMPAFQTK
ncbi:DUF1592 domain-containing protein [Lignipirellula cremea]|nr:DUF1592 domain-containing protein [Lignipirellula cremea]